MNTVLIVDDSARDRASLATLLGRHGDHLVLEASNGAEGLGLARVERPHLIVTDVILPKVNGYELIRELRADEVTAAIPIVVYAADYVRAETRDLVAAYGVTSFISKPAEERTVLASVEAALAEPRPTACRSDPSVDRQQVRLLSERLLERVRELELANLHQETLLTSTLRVQDEERERIACDIHDDSIQAMTAAAMRLGVLERHLNGPEGRERLKAVEGTVREAIARLRHLLFQLRPPELDEHGLATALDSYLSHVADDVGYRYELENLLESEPRIETRLALYRVAQEALFNVAKHAGASRVHVVLSERDDGYAIRIRDDGVGFDVAAQGRSRPGHLGLSSIRHRAELAGGTCRIESRPGAGTTVDVWIPGTAG
ncbi:MAG: response regulator [Actinobacteria bacterium]|nr:response regulator [Actinomycetota bacterium]